MFPNQRRDFGVGIDEVRVLLDLSTSSDRDCVDHATLPAAS